MILIDSVYVNDGGGLVLLKYLINIIEKNNIKVFYLFDNRTKVIFNHDIGLGKTFITNKFYDRKEFYLKNKDKFTLVLCFGNVPPPVKLQASVYVYFHQPLFLKIPGDLSFKNKIIYTLKQLVLNFYKKNSDLWIVQNNFIQKSLATKYLGGCLDKVKIIPFYPELDFSALDDIKRQDNTFLYVSNTSPHKNHEKLIEAFCNAYDKMKVGKLTLTVPSKADSLCLLIERKKSEGYPIVNVGFVSRDKLINLYKSNEYLIFPSLAESFGLGLAEAIDGGCKVLGADLPYTYEVCNPSLVFDPYNVNGIENAIITAITQELTSSNKVISNDINQLILLLSE
ncbi:MAG: glycosyltransferase [Acinetobacter sp.]|uniref:glycosyltransferase n=1 Tax=Acinetobacter guillouiae TaxID=106649 RepID=UPI00264D1AA4|nr:glycosyltransferase [Acinetobacter sp.]